MTQDSFYIYSKDGCGFCTRLVQFMDSKSLPYVKLDLNKDYSREQFYEKFGYGSTFPQVLYKNDKLGGMKDTVKYLSEKVL